MELNDISLGEYIKRHQHDLEGEDIGILFDKMPINDVIEFIEEYPNYGHIILNKMSIHRATAAFKILDFNDQKNIISQLSIQKTAELLNELPPDDRVAFLEELPHLVLSELLKVLNADERKITLSMLGYPEDSVGRIMTPDYIAVNQNCTVNEVFNIIRKEAKTSETSEFIYIVNEQGVLIDDIKIRDLILADPNKKIAELADHRFDALNAQQDQEHANELFKKTNRFALPVVDDNQILLGIVTIDDILWVAEEEYTEDIQKIGGMESFNESYLNISLLKLYRKRVGWLVILFLGELITASVMSNVESELQKAIVLSLFIPLILSSGGNSGSQASTLIIQSLTTGSLTLNDWVKVLRRELLSGFLLGVTLGIIGFIRVWVWFYIAPEVIGQHPLEISLIVMLSVLFIVAFGAITGSMLPLVLKKLGADPAVSSAPFVATILDVSGILIYFTISGYFLTFL